VVPVKASVEYPGSKPEGREPNYICQLPDPFIALARAGATTTKIKLGTGICLVPERNPLLTAKQIATLDEASVITGLHTTLRELLPVDALEIEQFKVKPNLVIKPTPNGANSRCCFVTWSIPPHSPANSTRKTGVTWCVHISGFVPKSSNAMKDTPRNSWEMVSLCTLGIPRHTKMTPKELSILG